MTAPAPTDRLTPTGTKLSDGHSTLITFARKPSVAFWEKSVKPFMMEGGDPVLQSTMHNVRMHTKKPRTLIDTGPMTVKVAYDEEVLDDILDMINVEDTITVTYPSGGQWADYGWLRSFDPQEIVEGTQPEANITIEISNLDPTDDSEADPNFVSAAGTD